MKSVTLKPFFVLIAVLAVMFLSLSILGQNANVVAPPAGSSSATDSTQFAAFQNLMEGVGWLALTFGCIAGVVIGIYSAYNRTALKENQALAQVRHERITELERDVAEKKLRVSQLKVEITELREENREIHDISLRRKALLDAAGILDVKVS